MKLLARLAILLMTMLIVDAGPVARRALAPGDKKYLRHYGAPKTLYHGTDSKFVKSIQAGVRVTARRSDLFPKTIGAFYLTDNFQAAAIYACKEFRDQKGVKISVIEFKYKPPNYKRVSIFPNSGNSFHGFFMRNHGQPLSATQKSTMPRARYEQILRESDMIGGPFLHPAQTSVNLQQFGMQYAVTREGAKGLKFLKADRVSCPDPSTWIRER
ncbi:hypothetical protein C8J56DRAFT_1051773 [Mycena floridula]|nr:hypothetical protein C8J56DRAFT_1051773 [Mycena floridula]